jgi:hypothetical protein
MRRQLLFLLAVAATASAQTDTSTITIGASRNVVVTPDQVVYRVIVETDLPAGLAEATALVADAGVTATDLLYTSSFGNTVAWVFEHSVPLSAMKSTNLALAKLIQQTASPGGTPSIRYLVTSLRTTPAAQSQACQLSALVSDARREAERLTAAVGGHVGAIVGLSDQPQVSGIISSDPVGIPYPGDIVPVLVPTGASRYDPLTSASTFRTRCSMVVQFRLLP